MNEVPWPFLGNCSTGRPDVTTVLGCRLFCGTSLLDLQQEYYNMMQSPEDNTAECDTEMFLPKWSGTLLEYI